MIFDHDITDISDIYKLPWSNACLVQMVQFTVMLLKEVLDDILVKCATGREGYMEIHKVEIQDVKELKDTLKWIDRRWFKKYIRCAPGSRSNRGEIGERKIIKTLFYKKNEIDVIYQIFGIRSRILLRDPRLGHVLTKESIMSWKSTEKADITIDFIDEGITKHPSIKCFDGSPPTLLNHTRRSAKYFKDMFDRLSLLDGVIKQMNSLREKGEIGEDIPYTMLELSEEEVACIVSVIQYFTFHGTGAKESRRPADSVLVVNNTEDILKTSQFYDCGTVKKQEAYVRGILPKLRFCMRSGKGMLPKSSKDYISDMKLCEPWIFRNGDKLCGALHIRYI